MRYWTADELASEIKMPKSWIYRRWKGLGLKKSPLTRHLRFTDESVKEVFGPG